MKQLVWIIISVGILHACGTHTGYDIMGELPDANGLKIVLKKITADSDEPATIDSCVVKKGKFRMKGMVEYPEYCVLYAGDHGPLRLFVENTVIHVTVVLENIQDSKVTGSMETDLLMEYFAQTDTMRQQRIEYLKQFITEHHNYIVTAMIVDNDLRYDLSPEELEHCLNGFDAVNRQSTWVQSLTEKVDAALRLANGEYIDVKMPTPDENEVALSDYIGKGNYVLINFWASWCTSSRTANPDIVKMYHKYQEKGFEIVGISLDKNKAEWTKAIEKDELVWPQISSLNFWQNKGAKLYSVGTIPYFVLLDKEGKILVRGFHLKELEEKLSELME